MSEDTRSNYIAPGTVAFVRSSNEGNVASSSHYDKTSAINYRRKRLDEMDAEDNISHEEIFQCDDDGDTRLHIAIIFKKSEIAIKFISKAPTNKHLSLPNHLFQTPLHLAVLTDQPEIVRKLVIAGTDVTSKDKDGNTALHMVCRDGKSHILDPIFEAMRLIDGGQGNNTIPLRYQQLYHIKNGVGLTCFHLAAHNRHWAALKILIANEVDINMKEEKSGRTALHNACDMGDITLVKFLLSYGSCDINARARDSSTPFDLARGKGHEHVCGFLAAAGAGRR